MVRVSRGEERGGVEKREEEKKKGDRKKRRREKIYTSPGIKPRTFRTVGQSFNHLAIATGLCCTYNNTDIYRKFKFYLVHTTNARNNLSLIW